MSLEYSWNRFSIGFRLNYFGQVDLLGYGDFNSLYPEVPSDEDENIRVRDEYKYTRKWVQDIFATISIID